VIAIHPHRAVMPRDIGDGAVLIQVRGQRGDYEILKISRIWSDLNVHSITYIEGRSNQPPCGVRQIREPRPLSRLFGKYHIFAPVDVADDADMWIRPKWIRPVGEIMDDNEARLGM
jgi:hypothetical protein